MRGIVVVLLLVSSCKNDRSASGDPAPPAATPAPTTPAPAATPAPEPAPAPPTPTRPTDEQAIAAVKTWIGAIAARKPADLVAASGVPFALTDELAGSCGGELTDQAELGVAAACLTASDMAPGCLGDHEPRLEVSSELPDPPGMVSGEKWTLAMPADRMPGHSFVKLAAANPKFPADVAYGLLAVRMGESGPVVDAATLIFSSEGD